MDKWWEQQGVLYTASHHPCQTCVASIPQGRKWSPRFCWSLVGQTACVWWLWDRTPWLRLSFTRGPHCLFPAASDCLVTRTEKGPWGTAELVAWLAAEYKWEFQSLAFLPLMSGGDRAVLERYTQTERRHTCSRLTFWKWDVQIHSSLGTVLGGLSHVTLDAVRGAHVFRELVLTLQTDGKGQSRLLKTLGLKLGKRLLSPDWEVLYPRSRGHSGRGSRKILRARGTEKSVVGWCFLEMSRKLHSWSLKTWLPKQDLNRDNTDRHGSMEEGNLMGLQP